MATWGKQVAKGWAIFQAKGCEVMPKNSEIMWKYQDQILTLKRYVYKPSLSGLMDRWGNVYSFYSRVNFQITRQHILKEYVRVCSVTQSRQTLCDIVDCSLPGSSVHGILQARILEWVAISYSRGSSWPKDGTHISCISCIGRQLL